MQATPQDIPGGIPNGRDTAEIHAHPGQMLDKKNPNPHAYPSPAAGAPMEHDGSPSIVPNAEANAQRLKTMSLITIAESEGVGADGWEDKPSGHFAFSLLYGDHPHCLFSRLWGYGPCDDFLLVWLPVDRSTKPWPSAPSLSSPSQDMYVLDLRPSKALIPLRAGPVSFGQQALD